MKTIKAAENRDLSFAPLSQTMCPHLIMSDISVTHPGERLAIAEKFIASGMHWLRLKNEMTDAECEVAIKWITCRYEGVYVALAPVYLVFDATDVSKVEYTLAEVVNKKFVRLLTAQELPIALRHMKVEVIGRRILPVDEQVTIFSEELEQMLGSFSEVTVD